MTAPFISICIPTYKRLHYLHRLLASIQIQLYLDYEIIITDDSPDNAVAQAIQQYKLPITYYKNNTAAGTPTNWNKAVSRANGQWIKLMHDDDWFAGPDALQQFADAATSAKNNFIFSACNYVYDKGKINISKLTNEKKSLLNGHPINLVYDNVIGHPSVVLHKKDNSILYDARYKWVVDIDFYIRYLKTHPGYTYINRPLINIGVSDSQVSAECYKNPTVEIPEYLQLLSTYPLHIMQKNQYVFYCIWNLIKKFKVKDKSELSAFYNGRLPAHIDFVIKYQQSIPRIILKQTLWSKFYMKKAFHKLNAVEKTDDTI